jgi:UDP-glucose 4-epimerase
MSEKKSIAKSSRGRHVRTGRRIRKRKSTVVITGISGRLGTLLARRLHRDPDVRVIGIDRRTFHRKPRDVDHLKIDIRRNKCEELFRSTRVDCIYHLGLMHDPRQNPDEHHSWNLVGTQRVFDYAQKYRVGKVVLLSSGDVYGPQPDNPAFISEDAPLLGARRFPQIRDLISVDMLAQSYFWKAPEIETVVLRPVNILGGVNNALSKYLRMQRVPTLLGFDPMIQVIHEEDAVSAVIAAAVPGIRGVLNVVGPEGLPLRSLIARAGKKTIDLPHVLAPMLAHRLFQARVIDMPAQEIEYVRYAVTLDGARARDLLKFRSLYGVDDAIDAALRRGIFDGVAA